MGYTHYWKHPGGFTDEQWAKIKADAAKILAITTVPLQHEYDEEGSLPVVNDEHIFFNGVGDDGYETFVLTKAGSDFEFCKTARKPYDLVVTAMLIMAHHRAPDTIEVSSDGDSNDWLPGQILANFACQSGHSGQRARDGISSPPPWTFGGNMTTLPAGKNHSQSEAIPPAVDERRWVYCLICGARRPVLTEWSIWCAKANV